LYVFCSFCPSFLLVRIDAVAHLLDTCCKLSCADIVFGRGEH